MSKKNGKMNDPYAALKKILSYYSCPSDCLAFCCRIQDIELIEKDLNTLRKGTKEDLSDLEFRETDGERTYIIKPPCRYLSESNKCTIYRWRPSTCKLFPFNFNPEEYKFVVYPCKMGVDISKDFAEYKSQKINEPIPLHVITNLEAASELYYSDADNDTQISLTKMSFSELIEFSKFLKSKK
jgi:Fe-S-cluster containining protein